MGELDRKKFELSKCELLLFKKFANLQILLKSAITASIDLRGTQFLQILSPKAPTLIPQNHIFMSIFVYSFAVCHSVDSAP